MDDARVMLDIAKHAARADATTCALYHVKSDDTVGDPLMKLQRPPGAGKGKPEPWAGVALQLYECARSDATGLGALNRYAVYTQDGEGRNGNRFVFRVGPDAQIGPAGELTSEPPNARGLLPQAYRHIEALMRQGAFAQATLVQLLCGQLERAETRAERAYAMVDRMSGKHVDMIEAIETVLDKGHERAVALEGERFKLAARGRLLTSVEPAIHKLLGNFATWAQRKFLQPSAADTGVADWDALTLEQQVYSLVSGLDEKELEKIIESLSEQSRAKLMKLWGRLEASPPDMKVRKGKANGAPAPAPAGKTSEA